MAAASRAWAELRATPVLLRLHLLVVAVAALVLPIALDPLIPLATSGPAWLIALVLVAISVLNVEISRVLSGGLQWAQQPHKALSAWAFAAASLLPTPWLLVIVPITYAHARWRGMRVTLWKWIWSCFYLILAGLAAAEVAYLVIGKDADWMKGDGGLGLVALALSALAFLATETLLFAGSAYLNHAEDEEWLRATLRSPSFYLTEGGVLLIGGLLAAVWTGAAWFVVFSLPIYAFAQRAALHEPLRQQAETAAVLADTNAELEEANAFKVDLLGMLGHEIGNPLTSIAGYAQLGREAVEDGDLALADQSLAVVERSAEQIREVVRQILAHVTSDTGALTAHPEPCRLKPHLDTAAASHRPGIGVPVVCPDDLEALVEPGHLDQMLANLLSNADKYAGGALRLSAAEVDGHVEVVVADAGPGVPEASRELIFERFARDAGTRSAVRGTGLGLFITRQLARANGGDVVLRDREPAGSEFVVRLRAVE